MCLSLSYWAILISAAPAVQPTIGISHGSVLVSIAAQVQIASDHALMLLNRCRAKLRSLQSLHQSRYKLCHDTASLQRYLGVTVRQQHLTPYELGLLQNSDKLAHHYDSLQEAACMVAECYEAEHHVSMFFQWLGTACQEEEHMSFMQACQAQVNILGCC